MRKQLKRSRVDGFDKGHRSKGTSNKKSRTASDVVYEQQRTLLINFKDDYETWFEYEEGLNHSTNTQTAAVPAGKQLKPPDGQVNSLREAANEIYRREVQLFVESSNKQEDPWIDSTIRKGTLKDRIAAMSLTVSQNPIHCFHTLDGLLQMTCGTQQSGGLPNSRVAQLAAEALEDLFLKTLLPPDRKLQTLQQRLLPFLGEGQNSSSCKLNLPKTLSPRLLLLWRYEEIVKEKFTFFLNNYLTKTLQEGLETSKISALRTASSLLRSVPEGETMILSLIVNKLGDPGKKLAAAASSHLKTVLNEHPNMQVVIAREVQQLAHRPHLSPSALYNCIAFLNQMKLERTTKTNDSKASLPTALINTYFSFFKLAISTDKGNIAWGENGSKSRLLSALLAGVNRAQPYLLAKDRVIDKHIDELYRVVHHAPPTAATQALALLLQVAAGGPSSASLSTTKEAQATGDRYYRALYSALTATTLVNAGKHSTMFFNILYKSIKHDKNPKRLLAMSKRLLSTCLHCNAPSLAASIFVLNDVATQDRELDAYVEAKPSEDGGKLVLQPTSREPQSAFLMRGAVEDFGGSFSRPSAWELSLTSHHYHPSASKFSSSAGNISYDGNPLQDFNLTSFLDKFAFRNPKKTKDKTKGFSHAVVRFSRPFKEQTNLEQHRMGDHGLFFRRFFDERDKRAAKKPVRQKEITGIDDDVDYDVFDQWDSDPEEEAFYEAAAQKMLENTAGAGPVDVDDDDDFGGVYDWDDDDEDEVVNELTSNGL